MSALLEGLADENGRIPFSLSGDDPIDHVQNGIPFDSNGSVAASLNGIIDHYHQGLPFDATGRLVITTEDVVRYGGGAAPFSADNALCAAGTPPVTHWNSGVPYTDNGKIAGSDVSVFEFVFNGTNQYAVMPDWKPYGVPFEIRVEATPETLGTEMRFVSADGDLPAVRKFSNDAYSTRFIDVDDSNHTAGSTVIATIGVPADVDVDFQPDRVRTTVNGIQGISSQFTPKSVTMVPLSLIAAGNTVPTYPWHGPLSALLLADNSPIQDTYANMGDGSRYGELEQPIVLEGDFEISFDWIRQDWGLSYQPVVGSSASSDQLQLYDTDASTPNRLSIVSSTGGSRNFDGALDAIAQGQHCQIKISRVGSLYSVEIDDAFVVSGGGTTNSFSFDYIGWSGGSRYTANGAALQNIVIKDLDNNYTFNYPLDEGPTTDTGPELISGAPTLIGGLASWDGSTLHLEGTNSSGTFEGATVADGGDYHVTFDYNTSAANTYIRLGGGGNVALIPGPAVGTFDNVLSAQGTGYVLNIASDNNSGDFTNFSVKSATGGDIIHNIDPSTGSDYNGAWTPDTDWTFIDSNTRYYPMNEGAGDTFHEAYSNPDPVATSPNLISNGKFTTTSDWTTSGGWTIDTGAQVAVFSGATDETIVQTFTSTPGKTYQIDFDIEIIVNQPVMAASGFATPVSGPVTVAAGNTQAVIFNETISTHIVRTIYAESPSTEFGFAGNGGTEFTVTNVEVREIVPGSLDATIINYTDNWVESVP